MKDPETTNNKIKQFNPDECLFIGTINELQQTLQETIRARINAENKLATMNKNNETYGLMTSPGKLLKNVAPKKAPIAPGIIRRKTIFLSTLPNLI